MRKKKRGLWLITALKTLGLIIAIWFGFFTVKAKALNLARLNQLNDAMPPQPLLSNPTIRLVPLVKPAENLSQNSQSNILISNATQITTTQTLKPPKDTACSVIWGSYPVEGGIPDWLTTPDSPEGLRTDLPYTFLAAKLIKYGIVDASDCLANGILSSGMASSCGLERARTEVTIWQNQFDPTIYEAAVTNAIPAQLLKRILAQESQFWFGASDDYIHFGPGQITQSGLDALLIWYPEYYRQICPEVFTSDTCSKRYSNLSKTERAMIRGRFLATRIEASCPNCPVGIDIYKAHQSIDIIAKLVVANCYQVNQIIYNTSQNRAGNISNYEDLWRITIGNYNVGGGCTSEAIQESYSEGSMINWSDVSRFFSDDCSQAIDYVDNITHYIPPE